jgi:hypothetical protein
MFSCPRVCQNRQRESKLNRGPGADLYSLAETSCAQCKQIGIDLRDIFSDQAELRSA